MPVVIMPVSVVTVNRATVSSPDFCDSRIVFVHATAGHVTLGTLIQHACDTCTMPPHNGRLTSVLAGLLMLIMPNIAEAQLQQGAAPPPPAPPSR